MFTFTPALSRKRGQPAQASVILAVGPANPDAFIFPGAGKMKALLGAGAVSDLSSRTGLGLLPNREPSHKWPGYFQKTDQFTVSVTPGTY